MPQHAIIRSKRPPKPNYTRVKKIIEVTPWVVEQDMIVLQREWVPFLPHSQNQTTPILPGRADETSLVYKSGMCVRTHPVENLGGCYDVHLG